MSRFTIKIDDKILQGMFRTMARRSTNMKPLMTLYAGIIKKEVVKNFVKQSATSDIFNGGEPDNIRRKWPALSGLTLAHRRSATQKGTGNKRLQATGNLFGSVGKVRVITNRSLEFGTSHIRAAIMHFGGTIKPVKAKKLAIPYPGVKGRPRQFDNTFFAKKSIFQTQPDGTIKPLFMLKDSVTIPPTHFQTIPEKSVSSMQRIGASFLLNDGKFTK